MAFRIRSEKATGDVRRAVFPRRGQGRRSEQCRPAVEYLEDRFLLSGGINEFWTPTGHSQPYFLTRGPDNNIWFTEYSTTADKIGRITPSGEVTEIPIPGSGLATPVGIAAGSDNNLWFTEARRNKIGRYDPRLNRFDEFNRGLTANAGPSGITAGPDRALWFTEQYFTGNRIGRIDTSGNITESIIPTPNSTPARITPGPVTTDVNSLWFTEYTGNRLGRIDSRTRIITEFPVGSGPSAVTAGPDGNLWFTENVNVNKIGRFDPRTREFVEFSLAPNSSPVAITVGPDSNLWITERGTNLTYNKIARMNLQGVVTGEYSIPSQRCDPEDIVTGPDNNLWFTQFNASQIGQVVLDQSLTATPTTVTATTGVPFLDTVVASFTEADPNPGPSVTYSAVIDWGDGTRTSTGGVIDNGGGNFDVTGSHAYSAAGSYTITVTITDRDDSHDIGGSTDVAFSDAEVSDPGAPSGGGSHSVAPTDVAFAVKIVSSTGSSSAAVLSEKDSALAAGDDAFVLLNAEVSQAAILPADGRTVSESLVPGPHPWRWSPDLLDLVSPDWLDWLAVNRLS